MKYGAMIRIDDDRWAKRPYSITIIDENGIIVERHMQITSREVCYRIADKYSIPHGEIEEEFY